MSSKLQSTADLKHLLLQQLQQKKFKLKQMEQKCSLQNKKIKLYRKENEQLQGVIEQMNQNDTNLLLGSKELLAGNAKLEKTIEDLRAELLRVKTVEKGSNNKYGRENKESEEKNEKQDGKLKQSVQSSLLSADNKNVSHTNISLLSILIIRQSTITQSTLQIDLPNCQLTDQQFTPLQSFPQLKSITVNDNLLTNQSVIMICTRFLMLEKLNLANNKFDSLGIKEIGNLTQLTILDVRNNNLGDQGITCISQLSKLTELSCSKNNITDKSLPNLCCLKQLTYFDITNNLLTSQSVNFLIKLEKLTHLYLMSNRLDKSSIITLLKSNKSLKFLDVRFNVWNNQDKVELRSYKPQNMEVFC